MLRKWEDKTADLEEKIISHIPEYPKHILKIPQNSIMRNEYTTKTMGRRFEQTIHQIHKDDKHMKGMLNIII